MSGKTNLHLLGTVGLTVYVFDCEPMDSLVNSFFATLAIYSAS